jgi:hypothetical protein
MARTCWRITFEFDNAFWCSTPRGGGDPQRCRLEPVQLAYLWRPALPDVDDNMVLEAVQLWNEFQR